MSSAAVEIPGHVCAACGEPFRLDETVWRTRADGPMHHACEVRQDRLFLWRDTRRLMRWDLAFPCAEALGQETVQPIIEPIGDDVRKPPQVLTALMQLRRLLLDSGRNPGKTPRAIAAVDRSLSRLRAFLGRKP